MVGGLACVLPVAAVLLYAVSQAGDLPPGADKGPALPVESLGKILFTTYAPAVLAVGVLLTAVMVGAVLFARDPDKKPPTSSDP